MISRAVCAALMVLNSFGLSNFGIGSNGDGST